MSLASCHQKFSGTLGREVDKFRIYPSDGPGRAARDIIRTISEYTGRNITHSGNNVKAAIGVFSSFMNRTWKVKRATKVKRKRPVSSDHSQVNRMQHLGLPILPQTAIFGSRAGHHTLPRRFVLAQCMAIWNIIVP
jgi:hypothetical protein